MKADKEMPAGAQEFFTAAAQACGCTRIHAVVAFMQVFDHIGSKAKGKMLVVTRDEIDTVAQTPGFSQVLENAGLLVFDAKGLCCIYAGRDNTMRTMPIETAFNEVAYARRVLDGRCRKWGAEE